MCFGGRLGELIATNDISTGAANDISQATTLARRMVCEWGMSDEMGPINFASDKDVFLGREMPEAQEHSEETSRRIDAEVRKIVDVGYKRAQEIITKHRDALDRIAEALLRFETITGEEVTALANGKTALELRVEAPAPVVVAPPPVVEPIADERRAEPRRDPLGGGATPAIA